MNQIHLRQALALFVILLFPLVVQSQRQAEIWHFGTGQAISFASGNPESITPSSMETFEGCVSYSDITGNLLFYSNGGGRIPEQSGGQNPGIIWNREHNVMYDMQGIEGGGASAIQSAIAFPLPGATDQYYLFTMEENEFVIGGNPPDQPQGRGLSYFIVDMTQNGGLGAVSLADQRVFVPSFEGLSATPMSDTEGHWVVCYATETAFMVVPVTASGVGDTTRYPIEASVSGQIKISPNGQYIFSRGNLFSFDPTTGAIDETPIHTFSSLNSLTSSFTPDSRYLYSVINDADTRTLVRFDLTAPDLDASMESFGPLGSGNSYQMQIASNGNLYFLEGNFLEDRSGLSEIACPATAVPTVSRYILEFDGEDDLLLTGLPNYVDAIFSSLASQEDTLVVDNGLRELCPAGALTLTPVSPGQMDYSWSDGSSDSTLTVTAPGEYAVTITGGCQPVVESFLVEELPELELFIAPLEGNVPCPGDSVDLTFNGNLPLTSISWPTGSSASVFRTAVVPGDSVQLLVTTSCGPSSATFNFPIETLTANLQTDFLDPLCPGSEVDFLVEGDFIDAVVWEDSSEGLQRSIIADSTVTYQAIVTSRCGDSLELVADLDYSSCPLVCEAEIPELITPNRDGLNDLFKVFTPCELEDYQLRIFNRWGQEVFSSSSQREAWEGNLNDVPQPMDMYLYRVQYRFPNNPDLVQIDGSFALVR